MKLKLIWLAATLSLLVNYALDQKAPVSSWAERPCIVFIFVDDMGFIKLLI